jgi:hypothetical protein
MDDYWRKNYKQQVSGGVDALTLEKLDGSDWCHLRMLTNDEQHGEICLRSREMAEHLHFMLGQLLRA